MIIDIRSKDKYNASHVEGAINISFNELFYHPSKYLNKDVKYHIYCETGSRSKILVNTLNRMGYNCVNIDGGYNKISLVK